MYMIKQSHERKKKKRKSILSIFVSKHFRDMVLYRLGKTSLKRLLKTMLLIFLI